ncbi:hypothetical protein HMPREF3039_02195 [Akkermansia sp. KLE1798]|nr:hypothetical protein HMPREF3039_02195 [Akkermansia sp. KLE1798]KZA05671.1 hypothetical protein HMPREF1326_00495 [Akkermansia sp. KLE1605]
MVSVSRIPTSEITAESLVVDGVSVSQTDHEGIHSSQRRSCISTGMFLEKTDGSGNTIMEETDVAGRPAKTTDPAGHVTTTSYLPRCDNPACITDALGGTTCYTYDIRSRKTAEYGTAIQPACFAYVRRSRPHGGPDYLPCKRRRHHHRSFRPNRRRHHHPALRSSHRSGTEKSLCRWFLCLQNL